MWTLSGLESNPGSLVRVGTIVCLLTVLMGAPSAARGQNAGIPSSSVSPLAPKLRDTGRAEGVTTTAPLTDDERTRLLDRIRQLEQRIAELEAERAASPPATAPAVSSAATASAEVGEPGSQTATAPRRATQAGAEAAAAPAAEQPNIAQQATDPTAFLLTHTLKTTYSPSYWGIDDSANVFTYQSVIPFRAWGQGNILRVTVPYTTTGPTQAGVGDVSVFDLMIFKKKAGNLAVGAIVNFKINRNSDVDTFEAGPAFGFVGTRGRLQYGIFNQNFFSTTTAASSFQPILAYQLGQGWSVSAGDLQVLVDWKKPDFVAVPASFQIGKVTTLGGQPVRLFVNPQYNTKNTPGTTKWSITFGLSILVPGRG